MRIFPTIDRNSQKCVQHFGKLAANSQTDWTQTPFAEVIKHDDDDNTQTNNAWFIGFIIWKLT